MPDKVPGQRLSDDILGDVDDGGGGVLFPDQAGVQSVLQVPEQVESEGNGLCWLVPVGKRSCRRIKPVQDPRLFGAGQSCTQFLCFCCHGGFQKL